MARKPTARSTLADVARAARVTPATASRALNGYTDGFSVTAEVRARIEDAARTLGYRAHALARSLRAKRTGLVGVLGLHPETLRDAGVAGSAVHAFTWVATRRGVRVCTAFLDPDANLYALPEWRIDGALLVAPSRDEHLTPVEDARLPYVALNGRCGPGGVAVGVDDVGGVRLAVEHLVALGHRRIGFAGPGGWGDLDHPSVAARRDGFAAAVRSAGGTAMLAPLEAAAETAGLWAATVARGATALIAYDHVVAAELLREAHARGVRVPDQLSLVAFNDEPICRLVTPSLTVVAPPSAALGETAAAALASCIAGEAVSDVRLACTLIARESTAAVRARDARRG